jgi:hypothetical protein
MGFSFVQGACSTATYPASLAFGSNNTAGNIIIVIWGGSTDADRLTVSDSKGNTYFPLFRPDYWTVISQPGNISSAVWVACNIASGANTVSFSVSSPGQYSQAIILEYSQTAGTVIFGAFAGRGTGGDTVPPIQNLYPIPGTVAGTMILSCYDYNSAHTWTPSGLTSRVSGNSVGGTAMIAADAAFSSYTPTASIAGGSADQTGIVVTMQLAPSSGGGAGGSYGFVG